MILIANFQYLGLLEFVRSGKDITKIMHQDPFEYAKVQQEIVSKSKQLQEEELELKR